MYATAIQISFSFTSSRAIHTIIRYIFIRIIHEFCGIKNLLKEFVKTYVFIYVPIKMKYKSFFSLSRWLKNHLQSMSKISLPSSYSSCSANVERYSMRILQFFFSNKSCRRFSMDWLLKRNEKRAVMCFNKQNRELPSIRKSRRSRWVVRPSFLFVYNERLKARRRSSSAFLYRDRDYSMPRCSSLSPLIQITL